MEETPLQRLYDQYYDLVDGGINGLAEFLINGKDQNGLFLRIGILHSVWGPKQTDTNGVLLSELCQPCIVM
ncbi:hypothetical protein NDU88_002038 [Pleurodeles waltl]|uniref:Uncharacterized protein n=1 Tax=Pleurodeles waltl TaxID=8319 RepID=A0AAV7SD70_PLEWA|nr:hypothetical protein NDU88_002038 [Pleurodeles waltl]